ncbi:MAG: amidohydrolase [Sutterella sp.]
MTELNVVEVWKDLHKTPELGFEEEKTSAYLAAELEKLGYEVTRGIGRTGVVGIMKGAEPGPVLMLRADMDALPFKNEDGTIARVHACGHDGHSAMLLTAAAELAGKVKKGTLKIFFQPAEETLHGALESIKDGVLDDVDIALGCHVRPIQDIPAGTCCAAVRHTASTFANIEISGRSSHASRPHLGVNCAEAAAIVTNAVCAVKGDPAKVWSCKVTSIQASAAATNIIPDTALLKLDIRAQTNELMDELLEKVRLAAEGGAMSVGATAKLVLPGVVIPAAVYDEDLVEEVADTIRETLGADRLARDCGGGGEDFHFFKKTRPDIKAAYFGVGAACTPGLHARSMTFDPEQLNMGVKVLVAMALKKIG